MPQLALSPEAVKALLTLLILAGAIYGFVSEKVSPDVTALLALLALLRLPFWIRQIRFQLIH